MFPHKVVEVFEKRTARVHSDEFFFFLTEEITFHLTLKIFTEKRLQRMDKFTVSGR